MGVLQELEHILELSDIDNFDRDFNFIKREDEDEIYKQMDRTINRRGKIQRATTYWHYPTPI